MMFLFGFFAIVGAAYLTAIEAYWQAALMVMAGINCLAVGWMTR